MAGISVSHNDIERLLGDIGAHNVAEILESGASIAELEEVAAHLAQETDVMGELERPLTGRPLRIFNLIRRYEAEGEEER